MRIQFILQCRHWNGRWNRMGDVNHSPIPFRVDLSKSYLTMITMETEDIQDIILSKHVLIRLWYNSHPSKNVGGKSFTLVVPSAVANVNVVCFKSGVSEILLEKAFKLLRRSSFTFLFFYSKFFVVCYFSFSSGSSEETQ